MSGQIHLLRVFAAEPLSLNGNGGVASAGQCIVEYSLDDVNDDHTVHLVASLHDANQAGRIVVDRTRSAITCAILTFREGACYLTAVEGEAIWVGGEWLAANEARPLQSSDTIRVGQVVIVCVGWQDLFPKITVPDTQVVTLPTAPTLKEPATDWARDPKFTAVAISPRELVPESFELQPELTLQVRNSGQYEARFEFEVHGLEGCAEVTGQPVVVHASGGEQQAVLRFDLSRHQHASNTAGWRKFDIKVTSPQYPGRWHTIPCALKVPAYTRYELRDERRFRWLRPGFSPLISAKVPYAIWNDSNRTVTFQLGARGQSGSLNLNWRTSGGREGGSTTTVAVEPATVSHVRLGIGAVEPKALAWLWQSRGVDIQVYPVDDPARTEQRFLPAVEHPLLNKLLVLVALVALSVYLVLLSWPRSQMRLLKAGDSRSQPVVQFDTSGWVSWIIVTSDTGQKTEVAYDPFSGKPPILALDVLPRRTAVFTITTENLLTRFLPPLELPNPAANAYRRSYGGDYHIVDGACPEPFEIGVIDELTGAWQSSPVRVKTGSSARVRWRNLRAVDGAEFRINGVAEVLGYTEWLSGERTLTDLKLGETTVALTPRLDDTTICPPPFPRVIDLHVRNNPPKVTQFDVSPSIVTATMPLKIQFAVAASDGDQLFLSRYVITNTASGREWTRDRRYPIQPVGILEDVPAAITDTHYVIEYSDGFSLATTALVSTTVIVTPAQTYDTPVIEFFWWQTPIEGGQINEGDPRLDHLDLGWRIEPSTFVTGVTQVQISGGSLGIATGLGVQGTVSVTERSATQFMLTVRTGDKVSHAFARLNIKPKDPSFFITNEIKTGKDATSTQQSKIESFVPVLIDLSGNIDLRFMRSSEDTDFYVATIPAGRTPTGSIELWWNEQALGRYSLSDAQTGATVGVSATGRWSLDVPTTPGGPANVRCYKLSVQSDGPGLGGARTVCITLLRLSGGVTADTLMTPPLPTATPIPIGP